MSNKAAILGVSIAGALTLACGGAETSITGPSAVPLPGGLNFSPQITVTPPSVRAQRSSDPAFEWEVAFEVTLTDVARRGIRIDGATVTIREEGGDEVYRKPFSELAANFTSSIPVGGTAAWSLEGVHYSLPGGGRRALGNVHFELETGVGDFRSMNFGFTIH